MPNTPTIREALVEIAINIAATLSVVLSFASGAITITTTAVIATVFPLLHNPGHPHSGCHSRRQPIGGRSLSRYRL